MSQQPTLLMSIHLFKLVLSLHRLGYFSHEPVSQLLPSPYPSICCVCACAQVYVDDLASPLLVTPLDLTSLLKLHHGRAWVGFTASTGGDTWQTQDVLSWEWQSLRTSRRPFPSPEVNQGANAFACADPDVCVHI